MSKILQPNTHTGNDGKSKRKLFTLKRCLDSDSTNMTQAHHWWC